MLSNGSIMFELYIENSPLYLRAMQRRQLLTRDGMKQVVILAIWAKGLHNVYDASQVAEWLGYKNDGEDRRRPLRNHNDDYLLYGDILAGEYRLLAVFDGYQEQDITLDMPGFVGATAVPKPFLNSIPGVTVQEKLQNTICMHTGITGKSAQLRYLIGSMLRAFELPWISFVIV
jgi:hypothetical protein